MHGKASAAPSTRETRSPTASADGSGAVAVPLRRKRRADPEAALRRIVTALDRAGAARFEAEIETVARALGQDAAEKPREPEGVRARHRKRCSSHRGGACDCTPSWEAFAYSRSERRKIRRTFPSRREAKAWRRRMLDYADQGRLRGGSRMTLAAAGERWLEMAKSGEITNRSGRPYKPSTLRGIEQDLRLRLVPEFGLHRMAEITRADLQRRIGAWTAAGLSASKVKNTINAARVLFRDFDLVSGTDNPLVTDPTHGLRLPHYGGKRDRIADPDEAARLIDALALEDRALWATAMDGGLRHGELKALRCEDLDLEHGRIHVRRGWDQCEGEIDPKSEAGKRTTCVSARLRRLLEQHLERTGRSGAELVFGDVCGRPFVSTTVNERARRAWRAARAREDEEGTIPEERRLRPIGLHECRHSAVSQMLDAGITIDKVSKFMGHASISITIDRYGHLLPGGEAEAAALLDAYHHRKR